MKKFVSAVAVLALVAFAAPALAATNPFMDVPMNHWAYDAIGQLAAHGILSGYPDGTYKGKQPTTRYEMASAIARALAVVDMTKASRQDVEMLQKLVVEFHDELEALGVTVADLEGKVNKLDSRLGGWSIHGAMRFQWNYRNKKDGSETAEPEGDTATEWKRSRIWFDRYFGEDEQFHFQARLHNIGNGGQNLIFDRFFVDMPFFFDSKLTVGRFGWNVEGLYYIDGDDFAMSHTGIVGMGAVATDRATDGIGIQKQFGLGNFAAYVSHTGEYYTPGFQGKKANGAWKYNAAGGYWDTSDVAYDAWELMLNAQMQFTEQFGFDLGVQGFFGDNAEPKIGEAANNSWTLDKAWTLWAAIRYDFNENIGFKGIYYHQKYTGDRYDSAAGRWYDADSSHWNGTAGQMGWQSDAYDDARNWKVALRIKQEALKYTGLWLEYGQAKRGFFAPQGSSALFFESDKALKGGYGKMLNDDMKVFRVAATQQWNEKWMTNLFYNGYSWDHDFTGNPKNEWGVGVEYAYAPMIHFGLQFISIKYEDGWDSTANASKGLDTDNIVRFRTQVTF